MWRGLVERLGNERGQIALPNLSGLTQYINPLLNTVQSGFNLYNQIMSNPTIRNLTGAGLTIGGLAQPNDPSINQGAREQAFQYLRNQFTSPNAIADAFGGQVNALNQQFAPLLNQQNNELLNNAQQRIIAGQPSSFSTAMGGPEVLAIRNSISRDIVPRQQAFMGELGLKLLDTQTRAARDVLNFTQPDPLAGLLTQLGTGMMGGQGGLYAGPLGQGGQFNPYSINGITGPMGQGGTIAGQLSSILGLTGSGANPQAAAQLAGQIGQMLGMPASSLGGFQPISNGAIGVLGQNGQIIATIGPQGQVINQTTGQVLGTVGGAGADYGLAGPGLLGPAGFGSLSGLLSSLGAAGLGYGAGQLASNLGSNQAQATLGGAGGGALAGFAVGGPVGALIGGIVGGVSGLFGERSQDRAEKAYNLSQDLDSQKDQVLEIGNAGVQMLQSLGLSPQLAQSFQSQVQQLASASAGPGDEQGAAATALNTLLHAVIPAQLWPTVAPQLKSTFIDYMTRSTFTAPNSSYGGGAPLNYINQWAGMAGLARGGYLPRGGNFIVGERGPELLRAAPGTEVVPLGQRLIAQMTPGSMAPRGVPQLLQGFGVPAHAYGAGGSGMGPTGPRPMIERPPMPTLPAMAPITTPPMPMLMPPRRKPTWDVTPGSWRN